MPYNILVQRPGQSTFSDSGDNYEGFDDANRRARDLFCDYAGYICQWETDGNYQDPDTGLTVMVGELEDTSKGASITYTVVEDGPGYIDPVIVEQKITEFDTANYLACRVFERLTKTERDIDPSGRYEDPDGLVVWVVQKN